MKIKRHGHISGIITCKYCDCEFEYSGGDITYDKEWECDGGDTAESEIIDLRDYVDDLAPDKDEAERLKKYKHFFAIGWHYTRDSTVVCPECRAVVNVPCVSHAFIANTHFYATNDELPNERGIDTRLVDYDYDSDYQAGVIKASLIWFGDGPAKVKYLPVDYLHVEQAYRHQYEEKEKKEKKQKEQQNKEENDKC